MIAVLFDVHAWIGSNTARLGGLDLSSYVQHVRVEVSIIQLAEPCFVLGASRCPVARARPSLVLTRHTIMQL